MRHLPTQKYSGLTVVLSQPSRQDLHALLTGYAGYVFDRECLSPRTSRFQCDIRTSDTISEGLLPSTRGLLLLGERSCKEWTTKGVYDSYTLNEQRGVPLKNDYRIPVIASYSPQDAVDMQNYEDRLNPHLSAAEAEGVDDKVDGDSSEYEEKKRHGKTSRSNYRHWLRSDTKKILWAIDNPIHTVSSESSWNCKAFPREDEIIRELRSYHNGSLYVDIETDSDYNILCFGLNHSSSRTVYCIPWLRYDYQRAYSAGLTKIIREIVLAMQRCCCVIHNSMFDLFVLAWKYRVLPPRKIWDTMYAQHRIFPEAEKSLGHCLTSWPTIWEPFHKDEGIFMPWNILEEQQLWSYNMKDVYGMRLIHECQMKYIESDEAPAGLSASIEQSNRCIRPFLLMSLQGIKFDDILRQKVITDNDRIMTQYLRALNILTGPTIELLPTSSKSCIRYFHDALGYPVVGRSPKTGAPSLTEVNMWRLKLKQPQNVSIDFCLKFRQKSKESGMLGFEPWIKE